MGICVSQFPCDFARSYHCILRSAIIKERETRRATNLRPDKELPRLFTALFDASYLHPPEDVALNNPFLSPASATDGEVLSAMPKDVLLVICEWDELRMEAECWRDRLRALKFNVWDMLVKGVSHGWDKTPNPVSANAKATKVYAEVCVQLARVFQNVNNASAKNRNGSL